MATKMGYAFQYPGPGETSIGTYTPVSSNPLVDAIMNPKINPMSAPGTWPGIQHVLRGMLPPAPAQGWPWEMPPQRTSPDIGYAQRLAAGYGDAPTAASTIGTKAETAKRIRKVKR